MTAKIDRVLKLVEWQREFSERTFGPEGRLKGVEDHINKEIKELYQTPDDLEEHADCMLLAIDWAWRSGISDDAIAIWLKTWWLSAAPGVAHTTPAAQAIQASFSIARAGRSPASFNDLISAAHSKLKKNKRRGWPDWRTHPEDKAIEHDRSKD